MPTTCLHTCRNKEYHPPRASFLPPELIDHIIGYLHDDHASLKQCALTCHALLPRARFHRFFSVKLGQYTFERFLQLLDASPDIALCVRNLTIVVQQTNAFFSTYDNELWVEKHLLKLAPRFRSIQKLEIRKYNTLKAAPFKAFTSVKELVLRQCSCFSMHEYTDLMSSFPSLESFMNVDVMVGKSVHINDAVQDAPPLRALEFVNCKVDPTMFVDWLISQSVQQHAERITLAPMQKQALIPVGRYFKSAGASIKHLRLCLVLLLSQGGISDECISEFSLAPLVGLETIEFGSPAAFARQYQADDQSFTWIATMLEQITSPRIRTVSFALWQGDLDQIQSSDDWDKITALLSSEQFRSLQGVEFHILANDEEKEKMVSILEYRLSGLKNRELLKFDLNPSKERYFPGLTTTTPRSLYQ
ncbi:unnamed protein product [Somion occarium]